VLYLKGYADGRDALAGVASWLAFYNAVRPHHRFYKENPGLLRR
jgi:putative transposase